MTNNLYFSKVFRECLLSIRDCNSIANQLLLSENSLKSELTFVDLCESGDYLTFMHWNQASKLLNNQYFSNSDLWDYRKNKFVPKVYNNNKRLKIKLGKFVNKLFAGKFTNVEIEKFVNLLKSSVKNEDISVVSGKDILYYYNMRGDKGSLWNSCMICKDIDYKGIFDLYINNPDVCKLVVLKKDGRLVARALLWKIHKIKLNSVDLKVNPSWFLDRVYYEDDYQAEKLKRWAISKGYLYRYYDDHHSYRHIVYNGQTYSADMTVKVKPKKYKHYPYLDTFVRYRTYSGLLFNNDNGDSLGRILRNTNGTYVRGLSLLVFFLKKVGKIFKR